MPANLVLDRDEQREPAFAEAQLHLLLHRHTSLWSMQEGMGVVVGFVLRVYVWARGSGLLFSQLPEPSSISFFTETPACAQWSNTGVWGLGMGCVLKLCVCVGSVFGLCARALSFPNLNRLASCWQSSRLGHDVLPGDAEVDVATAVVLPSPRYLTPELSHSFTRILAHCIYHLSDNVLSRNAEVDISVANVLRDVRRR